MALSDILESIDNEIAKLQAARAALSGTAVKKKPGRPKKAAVDLSSIVSEVEKRGKRNISPEGRKRIAEAVKRRWAMQKRSGSGTGK